jgi:hypothetical protein
MANLRAGRHARQEAELAGVKSDAKPDKLATIDEGLAAVAASCEEVKAALAPSLIFHRLPPITTAPVDPAAAERIAARIQEAAQASPLCH